MIANIDDAVGRLRAHLKANGLADDTIFIFTTDNGTSSGARVFNDGMRGQKGSEYDGGHRVPFFIHYPKGGLTGGRDVDMITSYVDVVPTLIDYCGAASPSGVKFDGVNIRGLLEGKARNWPDRILVTDSQRVRDPIKWRKSAVMTDRWRLINGKELYDIQADHGQKKNIAQQHPQVVARLTKFYDAWWEELVPSFGQPTAIYLGHPKANPATLTCHDWIADGSTPWNQRHIRNAEKRPNNTGFWAVDVKAAGEYTVELRRWPKEADAPITGSLAPGEDVPGDKAFRAVAGRILRRRQGAPQTGRPGTDPTRPGQRRRRHLQTQAQTRPRRTLGQVHRRRRNPHGRLLRLRDEGRLSRSSLQHPAARSRSRTLQLACITASSPPHNP